MCASHTHTHSVLECYLPMCALMHMQQNVGLMILFLRSKFESVNVVEYLSQTQTLANSIRCLMEFPIHFNVNVKWSLVGVHKYENYAPEFNNKY